MSNTVTVNFGDGVKRQLSYTLASARRLKQKLGHSVLQKDALLALDDECLPELLHEGLVDKAGLSVEDVAGLCRVCDLPYLMGRFVEAWTGKVAAAAPSAPEGAAN